MSGMRQAEKPSQRVYRTGARQPAYALSLPPHGAVGFLRRDVLDLTPEFFVAFLGDAHLDAVRRRAMLAPMREFAGDHRITPDIGVQIMAVGPLHLPAADVGPMPAARVREPVGGVPMVVELAADPDDGAGLGGHRGRLTLAVAIFGRLEEPPLLQEERMLLDVRETYVDAFPGGFHHEIERVGAGCNGALDGLAGCLSQLGFSFCGPFHGHLFSLRSTQS